MSLTRQSDSNNSQPVILGTQSFEELARSRPEFENVGVVESITRNSINPHRSSYKQGSGVYIGNQIVLTAAQILPSSFKEGVFASSMKHETYFVTTDNDGNTHAARVILANRHPLYKINNTSIKNVRNDIAILVLDREFKHLEPISTHFTPIDTVKDCIHVGYTDRAISSLPFDNKRVPAEYYDTPIRVAVKFPGLCYMPYAKLHTVSLGSSLYAHASALGGIIQCQLVQKHPYDPLESGTTPGMYGGGYFNRDSLLGIVSGDFVSIFAGTGSSLPLDEVLCVPLFTHKQWIEKTLADYQKQLPALMLQSKQWYKDNKQYKLTQNKIREFVSQNHADWDHEGQPLKKPKLDELAQKICELHARGDQELRTNALYKIYLAFKNVNLDSEPSLKSYHCIYKENINVLKEFDTTGIRRTIGSFFTSTTSTYKLIVKLNDFIEENSYPSEKLNYHIRYGEPC